MIEFRLQQHHIYPDRTVVELWADGLFVGEVVPAPHGVIVLSKYPIVVSVDTSNPPVNRAIVVVGPVPS